MAELLAQNKRRQLSILAAGVALWLTFFLLSQDPGQVFKNYGHFFFLGLIGAIIANSTGAGGGIVFIPAFSALGLSPVQALATSIGIQCLGMTAGSLSWLNAASTSSPADGDHQRLIKHVLVFGGIPAITGILCGQYLLPTPPFSINAIFSVFSIIFGIALLLISYVRPDFGAIRTRLTATDRLLLMVTSCIGGAVTSWISIGVGEWLALTMFLRGYPPLTAVSVAVCVSSITVLTAAPFHLAAGHMIFDIILFAGPAAIIGGSIARHLSRALGPEKLKVYFGIWILITGILG